ncbi:hypothetical protein Esi_0054_0061 [Ectocarpus siliculosus]|uniref:Uncharacterized protein n=1 Tax=Ectocarpus siliculosus TaxID=2880 RepID=D7G3Z9_ECTSI|nr:hypothetical protein Esi_0054_0061 [Ectocarpus siliculosus]|eukprot:CBJ27034.1 hypothetical protein Esi_0054_0061 [Ectocarpus siliculosus]
MSTDASASAPVVKDAAPVNAVPALAAGTPAATGANSVASTANQILFKNELYTSMKQKTMDQELMARFNREAHEEEKRKFEKARAKVARLENKRKVLIGVGDMVGPPGCDPSECSSASVAVDLGLQDTVRDVKKRLIAEAGWRDELPSDFGLFNDVSEEPLMDGQSIDAALAPSKPSSAKKGVSRRGGSRATAAASIRLPRPYVGVLWAARLG